MNKLLFCLILSIVLVSCTSTSYIENPYLYPEIPTGLKIPVSSDELKHVASDYMKTVEVTGDEGLWRVGDYVDNFKLPTGKHYIYTANTGVFTNSATNGSDLLVQVLCNENDVEINLLEYGSYPISVIEDNSINVMINANGKTIDLGFGKFNESTKRIKLNKVYPLFKALVENEVVKMYIEINDYGVSTYLFDIYSAGFEYNYHKAFLE